jgi:hypothetical protein
VPENTLIALTPIGSIQDLCIASSLSQSNSTYVIKLNVPASTNHCSDSSHTCGSVLDATNEAQVNRNGEARKFKWVPNGKKEY